MATGSSGRATTSCRRARPRAARRGASGSFSAGVVRARRVRAPSGSRRRHSLRADLDQVEALSPEREALWARIERVTFLTLNEKRQAVGYTSLASLRDDPVEEPVVPPAPESDATVVIRRYRADQARAPRGESDGGSGSMKG